ncbi:hypothetical protein [Priestia megaterium]|uniref:hypothetical protein n=1 Tax=Priestia megaterium TaxID=1404 RepID=UPI000BFA1AD6|nr:hypothetical protein [Priestia megaterium]PFR93481.1 hypothetical protein COK39_17475 [Priestia megaterium]
MKRIKQLQILLEEEKDVVEIVLSRKSASELIDEITVMQQKLNSIRCYMEMLVPRDELEPAILAVLDDPNHDGI